MYPAGDETPIVGNRDATHGSAVYNFYTVDVRMLSSFTDDTTLQTISVVLPSGINGAGDAERLLFLQ